MSVKIFSCMPFGLEGRLVEVEADIMRGLPAFTIVGLGDAAVQEAKERIRSAIKNSGFEYPQTKKIINLAPAHLKKHGPQFDLPMAVSLLVASGQVGSAGRASDQTPTGDFERTLIVGELALDGSVRAVNGILTMALFARNNGWARIIIPLENYAEASLVKGIEIVPVGHLREIENQNGSYKPKNGLKSVPGHTFRMGDNQGQSSTPGTGGAPGTNLPQPSTPGTERAPAPPAPGAPSTPDFSDILGQEHAKRALTIAAAGNHHILLFGPPGTGKTMLAKAMPGILTPLTEEEMFEVLQIYSCAGLFHEAASAGIKPALSSGASQASIASSATGESTSASPSFSPSPRPFRQVHNTCSLYALTGGGSSLKPGEISLAHRGVLFMDEIAEFPRAHLESLRQPLEGHRIHISRASGTLVYPADFMLVAGMNPCPCGFHGDPVTECKCRPYQVIQYRKKISGPIMDRIELHIEVPRQPMKVFSGPAGETSAQVRARVVTARAILAEHFSTEATRPMSTPGAGRHRLADLTPDCRDFLHEAGEKLRLSGRGLHQVIKVARTIAALSSREEIRQKDLAEALQYGKTH